MGATMGVDILIRFCVAGCCTVNTGRGSGFFFIPGIGPLMVFGPLVSWIIGALEGAAVVGGLSALGAGLYSLGIPKNSVVEYEKALKSDQFLVMAWHRGRGGTGEAHS
jgi:hypothetical protein